MQSIVILGGDNRSRFLDTYFRKLGFSTYCFGVEQDIQPERLQGILRGNMAALILPLPASRDGKTVNMPLCKGSLSFAELTETLPENQTVFGGMLSREVTAQLCAAGAWVIDYYDEDVIVKNAVLTAIGTMRVLAEMTAVPPAHLHIAVTGFGRVGEAVAEQLLKNGCVPMVAARRSEVRETARKAGYKACSIEELQAELSAFDIVINTVPARIFTAEVFAAVPHVQYMELASAPYGMDLETAKTSGVTVVNAQSLPGKYLPDEAAQIVGEKIKSFL